ncbi:2-C-methyl-D-erythritol 4-phosphate cytidylyltransferase [Pengzhenrongella frigida]|uniref:2-C-methyl-D-erythritol 4-phosphate cytidylyltransferase n=1 Tax=Pengzhenrongella frigida TaxID=1259133 RepID=A0A4Q5N3M0_9MICO|nr:2-C-methyl-D-erythritol 4-phosphate cytidylyltransferase [Cellulomonas sp. HLT2-17]RYV51227.1 2-C-methyl-D-erythritol 4-phosphate cytidylyltransferase [Cellulomonas sp. HLT2-17]
MSTAAILTAAGSGSRLGHLLPKALVPLAGVPLVVHAARRLVGSGAVDLLVVTAPADSVADFQAVLDGAQLGIPVSLVVGGASRQASVAAALAQLPPEISVVLVHDAARALAPSSLIARVEAAVRSGLRAVVPGARVTDTIIEVAPAGGGALDGRPLAGSVLEVVDNPDRDALRIVQTPQGFDRALLVRAHAAGAHRADDETRAATDDASLVAALGEAVHVVTGDPDAAKITTSRDLRLAEIVLADARAADQSGVDPADDQTGAHAVRHLGDRP